MPLEDQLGEAQAAAFISTGFYSHWDSFLHYQIHRRTALPIRTEDKRKEKGGGKEKEKEKEKC